MVKLSGIVNGKKIELEGETGLPAGSHATVSVEEQKLSPDEIDQLIDRTAGAWKKYDEMDDIFWQIEHERTVYLPREIDFDAPFGQ